MTETEKTPLKTEPAKVELPVQQPVKKPELEEKRMTASNPQMAAEQFMRRGSGGGGGGQRGGGGRGGRRGDRNAEKSEYEEEVLQIDRVTRVVKGGRRLRFRATVVIGNKNGKVGLGIGKSTEVVGAIKKAIHQAKKNILVVNMKNGTLPHEIYIKYKSARLMMMPASPGTGIKAGGAIRKIAELAGFKNMLSKMFGNSNKITNAKATMLALAKLTTNNTYDKPTQS